MEGGWTSVNGTFTMMIPNPVTEVSCCVFDGWNELSEDVYYVQQDGVSLGSLGNLSSLADKMTNPGVYTEDFVSRHEYGKPIQLFEPLWLASPEPRSSALVGSFFTWENSGYMEPQNMSWRLAQANFNTTRAYLGITTCSVSSNWNTAQSSMALSHGKMGLSQVGKVSELEWRDRRNITVDVADVRGLSDLRLTNQTNIAMSYYFASQLSAVFTVAVSKVLVLQDDHIKYRYVGEDDPKRPWRVEVKFTL